MTRNRRAWLCLSLAGIAALGGNTGCSGVGRGPAVPKELQDRAVVHGMANVRTWGDQVSPEVRETLVGSLRKRQAQLASTGHAEQPPSSAALAISGGGANGAFGAGLLCGWTQKGDRPQFDVVTGISTGALMAPFVFLGPEYDPMLREVYTTMSTKSILERRFILTAIFKDALTDNKPLWTLTSKYIDQKMLDAIAVEYEEKGRLLLIGTTNLDARRSVIWNIGAIAASKQPGALHLVRSILIASAAIPAAFPPVMIDVEADGRKFQEMHVDGGCLHEVFLYPTSFTPVEAPKAGNVTRERRAYIIRNSRIDPDWADVERRTLKIAARAIDALIYSQGVGDLDPMFMTARRDKMEFNLAYIPADFDSVPKEPFDPEYMRKLFDVGFNAARAGYPWSKTPPGYLEAAGK